MLWISNLMKMQLHQIQNPDTSLRHKEVMSNLLKVQGV